MNLPQVYMCSPSWTPLPPPFPYHPSGSSLCTSPKHPVSSSNLDWQFVSYMILYMFQCHSPKSSHPFPLPQSPRDCSIYLCLFCCLTYRVIVTIFHSLCAAAAKLLQSCQTLCNPIDSSPSGSSVHGILQARTLEWVAISSSNAWKWKVKVKSLSRVRLLATPWTAAYQAPLSMGFSRREYWSGVPLPSPYYLLKVTCGDFLTLQY